MQSIEERTIALAGLFQACLQVQSLARSGRLDEADFQTAIRSILTLDAVSSSAVYGGVDKLHSGLTALANGSLVSPSANSTEVLRYVMSILHLQRQLFGDQQQLEQFSARIEALSGFSKADIPERCSEIYQQFVSVLRPQIIVNGEEEHLQRVEVPVKIRTLLLAAIRSAVLWEQKGGGRFNLIWQRTRMQNAAKSLLHKPVQH